MASEFLQALPRHVNREIYHHLIIIKPLLWTWIPSGTGALISPDMTKYTLRINGKSHEVEVEPDTPLLWVLRDELELKGTKFGCGMAQCGACTVHVNGSPMRSCMLPVASAATLNITTIEGLADGDQLHPVQQAWIEEDVAQCGYCQAGQIMTAAALVNDKEQVDEAEIAQAMWGNICRCGTYPRIKKAVIRAFDIKNG